MQAGIPTTMTRSDFFSAAELSWGDDSYAWEDAKARLLEAIDADLRPSVERLLSRPRFGGAGLRCWAERIAAGATVAPTHVPAEVVQVYLDHSEAMPHHDCGNCGLAVPVIPSRRGDDGEPERAFFPTCPCCGGKTGHYLYWATARLRRAKPR